MVIGGFSKRNQQCRYSQDSKIKYNIDVTEHQNLDLDSLPSEVKDLCSQYDKNFEDMEGYFETGSVLMGLGVAFHEAGYFLDSLQASIAEKSKKAYESLKNWFNKTFKGEVELKTYTVDPSMQAKDIEMEVLIDGVYIKKIQRLKICPI